MKNVADLLVRFWQGSQPASNVQVAAMVENRDQSSMARFCPHPAGLRSRPVRQELGATASVRDTVGCFLLPSKD